MNQILNLDLTHFSLFYLQHSFAWNGGSEPKSMRANIPIFYRWSECDDQRHFTLPRALIVHTWIRTCLTLLMTRMLKRNRVRGLFQESCLSQHRKLWTMGSHEAVPHHWEGQDGAKKRASGPTIKARLLRALERSRRSTGVRRKGKSMSLMFDRKERGSKRSIEREAGKRKKDSSAQRKSPYVTRACFGDQVHWQSLMRGRGSPFQFPVVLLWFASSAVDENRPMR